MLSTLCGRKASPIIPKSRGYLEFEQHKAEVLDNLATFDRKLTRVATNLKILQTDIEWLTRYIGIPPETEEQADELEDCRILLSNKEQQYKQL